MKPICLYYQPSYTCSLKLLSHFPENNSLFWLLVYHLKSKRSFSKVDQNMWENNPLYFSRGMSVATILFILWKSNLECNCVGLAFSCWQIFQLIVPFSCNYHAAQVVYYLAVSRVSDSSWGGKYTKGSQHYRKRKLKNRNLCEYSCKYIYSKKKIQCDNIKRMTQKGQLRVVLIEQGCSNIQRLMSISHLINISKQERLGVPKIQDARF